MGWGIHEYGAHEVQKRVLNPLRAGVPGSFELQDVGAGKQTQVLWKSN